MRSVLAATLLAALLRLFRLGAQSLWIDELFTRASAEVGGRLSLARILEDVHGPLFSFAVHLWTTVAGDSEWALRFPSAVAGTLTVPVVARLADRWLGRETAIPAAWLAAASPFLVWYGQEARNYSWLILFSSLAALLLLELRARASAGGTLRYAGAAAAAALSNLSFALVLPLHAKWGLGAIRGRRGLLRAAAILLALALLALPWLPQISRTWDWRRLAPARAGVAGETPLRGPTTFHAAAVPFAMHAFAVGYTLGPSLRELRADASVRTLRRHAVELALVAVVFGAIAALGLRALARRGRLVDALLWLVLPALVVSYFASQNFKVFHPRYLAVGVPCALLATAAALADARPRLRGALALGVGGLWAVSLTNHYFVPAYGREDYRGALARVIAGAAPGEQVLAVGSEEPVVYYSRGALPVGRFWLGHVARPATLDAKLEQALSPARGTWIVLSREEDLDPGDSFARSIARLHPDAPQWRHEGVRVWHVVN